MSKKINYLWVTLLVSLTCGGLALAQVTTGTISGTVRDETGAVLPGVTINALNTDTGITRTVVSDDEGRYHAVNLAVGPYEIRAELTGFQSSLRSGSTKRSRSPRPTLKSLPAIFTAGCCRAAVSLTLNSASLCRAFDPSIGPPISRRSKKAF